MVHRRQVKAQIWLIKHKLFHPNAWMKVLHFNVSTSCPKDELHQWFIGLYCENIIPAIVHRYTQVMQRLDLVTLNQHSNCHPLLSNESIAQVFKRLVDRLQDVVSTRLCIIGSAFKVELDSRNALWQRPLRPCTGCWVQIGVQADQKPSIRPNNACTVCRLISCVPCRMAITGTALLLSKLERSGGAWAWITKSNSAPSLCLVC